MIFCARTTRSLGRPSLDARTLGMDQADPKNRMSPLNEGLLGVHGTLDGESKDAKKTLLGTQAAPVV